MAVTSRRCQGRASRGTRRGRPPRRDWRRTPAAEGGRLSDGVTSAHLLYQGDGALNCTNIGARFQRRRGRPSVAVLALFASLTPDLRSFSPSPRLASRTRLRARPETLIKHCFASLHSRRRGPPKICRPRSTVGGPPPRPRLRPHPASPRAPHSSSLRHIRRRWLRHCHRRRMSSSVTRDERERVVSERGGRRRVVVVARWRRYGRDDLCARRGRRT